MKKIASIIAIAALISMTQAADQPQTAKAGIITSFKQRFFDEYKQTWNAKFIEQMLELNLPGFNRTTNLGPLKLATDIFNFKINKVNFNSPQSEISVHKDKPNLVVSLVQIDLDITLDYSLQTTPELFNEVGSCNVILQNATATVKASPKNDQGTVQFDFEKIQLDLSEIGVKFNHQNGNEDVAEILNVFTSQLQVFIKEYLIGTLNVQTQNGIQSLINDLMFDVPQHTQIYNNSKKAIEVDYSLVDQGVVVTDEYISILLDGSFNVINETAPAKEFTSMPVHIIEAEEIQIFISEYMLSQALVTVVKMDFFHYVNTYQTSDNVDAMITEFENAYGEHSNCTIVIEAAENMTKFLPQLRIRKDGSTLDFFVEIQLKNPLDLQQDAARIIAKMSSDITFTISDDFYLYGDIVSLKLEIVDFTPFFSTKTTAQSLQQKVGILVPIMESYANSLLDSGMKIPISKNITKYILKEKVTTYDGYILIDGDADFTQKLQGIFVPQKLQEFKKYGLKRDLYTEYQKEKAMEQFYDLVQKVSLHKLENGYADKSNYDDVYTTLEELTSMSNSSISEVYGLPIELTKQVKEVKENFSTGLIVSKDINLEKISEIGREIVTNVLTSMDAKFKDIRQKVFAEFKADLSKLEKVEKKVESFFSKIFRGGH